MCRKCIIYALLQCYTNNTVGTYIACAAVEGEWVQKEQPMDDGRVTTISSNQK